MYKVYRNRLERKVYTFLDYYLCCCQGFDTIIKGAFTKFSIAYYLYCIRQEFTRFPDCYWIVREK